MEYSKNTSSKPTIRVVSFLTSYGCVEYKAQRKRWWGWQDLFRHPWPHRVSQFAEDYALHLKGPVTIREY